MQVLRTLLLVNPPYSIEGAYYLAPQLGLAIAAGQLKCADIPFTIVDQALELAEGILQPGPQLPQDAAAALLRHEPTQIAFSVQCFNAPIVIAISDWIRKLRPSVEILAGGHHAKHLRVGRAFGCVDAVLEDATFLTGTPASGDEWRAQPDYDRFPDTRRYVAASRQFSALVEVARGCPYACSFCSIPDMLGSRRRYKPISQFSAEINFWDRQGINDLHFVDDVLTVGRRALEPFLQFIESHPARITWTGMTRADLVDPAYLVRLARAGCRGLLYGVESGDPTTRSNLNKRAGRYPDIADLARWNVDAQLQSTFYFLFNLPGEAPESVLCTIAEACRISTIDPGCARLNLPRLVPGTNLWEQARDGVTLDVCSPYSDTLRATVGEGCVEISDLLKAQPEVFATYYATRGPLDPITANVIARNAASLLGKYPVTLSLLSSERLFLPFFRCICEQHETSSVADILFSFLAERIPGAEELPATEALLAGKCDFKGDLPIDLRAAREAAIDDPIRIRSTLKRALRRTRTAEISKVRQSQETCYE